jgi:hypothetical protein
MPIFLILRRKIKKTGIHSKYLFAAPAAKGLLRQVQAQKSHLGCLKIPLAKIPSFEKGLRQPGGSGETNTKSSPNLLRQPCSAGRSPA